MQEKRIIRVLCLKEYSGDPADGIDNFNRAVFSLFPSRVKVLVVEPCGRFAKLAYMIFRRPDYILGNGHAREVFFLFFKSRHTRYVINFHTILLRSGADGWRVRTPWFIRSFIFNRAWAVVCVSEYIASTVRALFPHMRVTTILNGVDTDFFSPSPSVTRKPEQIVFIGTLQQRKRPDIVCSLARALPEARFVFVGRNFAPWHFARMIGDIPNAEWWKSLSRVAVARLFAESSIFIFPSVNEPAAAVILEAMASGCVPVVSRSGGNTEFFEDGISGYAIPCDAGEQEAFMAAIKRLMGDSVLRAHMARAARAEAERHSWRMVAEAYADFFK